RKKKSLTSDLPNKGAVLMKKFFLPVYTIVVFSIVIWFALHGEHRDPRFYVSILIIAIIGKFIASHIDKEK
ncbi:MAG TPA: hypothetical protein DER14_05265, partial [Eubacterium sp.]|nr:hypothetical protein [Eubacterium sp.]